MAKADSFYTFQIKKQIHLWGIDKETLGFGVSVKNLNHFRVWVSKIKEVTRFFISASLWASWPEYPISRDKGSPSICRCWDFSHERFISCFQGDREEGQSVPLALPMLSVNLIQNNQHPIKAYLGLGCPGLQQYFVHIIPEYSTIRTCVLWTKLYSLGFCFLIYTTKKWNQTK